MTAPGYTQSRTPAVWGGGFAGTCVSTRMVGGDMGKVLWLGCILGLCPQGNWARPVTRQYATLTGRCWTRAVTVYDAQQ